MTARYYHACRRVARPNFICQQADVLPPARKCELVAAQAATERIFFEQHLLISISSLRVVALITSTMSSFSDILTFSSMFQLYNSFDVTMTAVTCETNSKISSHYSLLH